MRTFKDAPGAREGSPLLLGIVGPSGTGKTFSALRLASGIVGVTGGEIFVIDTEARRALHYADLFKFRHVDFAPPFGPLDYRDAIQCCIDRKAACVIVDSMTHEHSGEGGIVWQHDQFLEKFDTEAAREKNNVRAWIQPKKDRATLTNAIIQHGRSGCAFIFCYRAHEKLDFKNKENGKPREMGFQAETTSPLMYEMTQQFLLVPGADGVPLLRTSTRDEARIIKSPFQFRDWFNPNKPEQLSEELGARMAQWAKGKGAAKPQDAPSKSSTVDIDAACELLRTAPSLDALQDEFKRIQKRKAEFSEGDLARLVAAKDAAKAELQRPAREPGEDDGEPTDALFAEPTRYDA